MHLASSARRVQRYYRSFLFLQGIARPLADLFINEGRKDNEGITIFSSQIKKYHDGIIYHDI
jgi:hypothetical protein